MEPYPKAYLYRRVVKAKLFIDAHYAEEIDVDDISSEAAFSKFHFIRLFKEVYGRTPHEHLTYVRIGNARRLLAEGLPSTDACFAVGFSSMGSFSRLFKRHVGMPPSVFRDAELSRRAAMTEQPLAFVPGCFAAAKGWS